MSEDDVVIDLTVGVMILIRSAYKLGALDQKRGARLKDDYAISSRVLNVVQGKEEI